MTLPWFAELPPANLENSPRWLRLNTSSPTLYPCLLTWPKTSKIPYDYLLSRPVFLSPAFCKLRFVYIVPTIFKNFECNFLSYIIIFYQISWKINFLFTYFFREINCLFTIFRMWNNWWCLHFANVLRINLGGFATW